VPQAGPGLHQKEAHELSRARSIARIEGPHPVDGEVRQRTDEGAQPRRKDVVDAQQLDQAGQGAEIEGRREQRGESAAYEGSAPTNGDLIRLG